MTLEERVAFLHQSIESHDRQLGDLPDRVASFAERVDQSTERLDRMAITTQLNFDRLTQAMLGLTQHVENHAHRIERLDDR